MSEEAKPAQKREAYIVLLYPEAAQAIKQLHTATGRLQAGWLETEKGIK